MSMVRFIGDIHGSIPPYKKICEQSPYPTVQIGDFGYGFIPNVQYFKDEDLLKHRFIRGNHDDPAVCKLQPNFIQDGTIEGDIVYIGGASSIDRAYRTEGVSWWRDEQLSYAELERILSEIHFMEPSIVVSHECPDFIADWICVTRGYRKYDNDGDVTRKMLEAIYTEKYRPKLHIFGHWHMDIDYLFNGTRFICLNELSYIDINTDDVLEGEIVSYHTQYPIHR